MEVEECITAAPTRGFILLREPSVYIHSLGLCTGCHVMGWRGGRVCLCCDGVVGRGEFGIARRACDFVRGYGVVGCLVYCVGMLYLFYEP